MSLLGASLSAESDGGEMTEGQLQTERRREQGWPWEGLALCLGMEEERPGGSL